MYGELLKNKREIKKWREARAKQQFPVIFTNGCFDLFHSGHAEFLHSLSMAYASKNGQILAALNSDKSVHRLKGPGRPIVPAEQRAIVVGACRAVSAVCIFDEDTPLQLIELVRPDVLAKAEDYKGTDIVGKAFVESYGGRVVFGTLKSGVSTSIIEENLSKQAVKQSDARAALARDVYQAVLQASESFEENHLGADLAYLMGAILCNSTMDIWKRNHSFVALLEKAARTHPAVWKHIVFKEKPKWLHKPA